MYTCKCWWAIASQNIQEGMSYVLSVKTKTCQIILKMFFFFLRLKGLGFKRLWLDSIHGGQGGWLSFCWYHLPYYRSGSGLHWLDNDKLMSVRVYAGERDKQAQISLHICASWSESLQITWILFPSEAIHKANNEYTEYWCQDILFVCTFQKRPRQGFGVHTFWQVPRQILWLSIPSGRFYYALADYVEAGSFEVTWSVLWKNLSWISDASGPH